MISGMPRTLPLAILLATALYAQSVGVVTGLVTDSSQAVVPGAKVNLKAVSTGIVSTQTTNAAGLYHFPSVLNGPYELAIEATGFKGYLRSGLTVETGVTLRVDVALEIGATQDSVRVTAEVPLLSQETSSVGTQVNQQMLNSLPFQLSGSMRNPFAVLRLTPGAQGNSSSGGDTRIAGGRGLASEVFVDGVQMTYNASQSVADVAHPAYDTIAEFRVEAVLPPAEYGRTSGGVVLTTSRSGTPLARASFTNSLSSTSSMLVRTSRTTPPRPNRPSVRAGRMMLLQSSNSPAGSTLRRTAKRSISRMPSQKEGAA